MHKIKIAVVMSVLAASLTLGGCSSLMREKEPEQTSKEAQKIPLGKEQVVFSMDKLDEGGYYVRHVDEEKNIEKYARLFKNQGSFVPSKDDVKQNDTHVLWFTEDELEKIPTMYEGDSLIFHQGAEFEEKFRIERYEDLGFTIGLSNLKKTDTGRYMLNTAADNIAQIDMESDAKKMLDFKGANVIIDQMGNSPLRSGNVTRAGTIVGLEKDNIYQAEVYLGTNLTNVKLKADVCAMASSDYLETTDYDFLRSTIIEIHLPDYYNSGYYFINGYGIMRYVKGTEFDNITDFNIPNIEPTPTPTPTPKPDKEDENSTSSSESGEDTTDTSSVSEPVTEDINTESTVSGTSDGATTQSVSEEQPVFEYDESDPNGTDVPTAESALMEYDE